MSEIEVRDMIRKIEAAYEIETDGKGGWVMIADIREYLGSRHARQIQDEALRILEQDSGWMITPESNQKVLTEQQRAGAVWIGLQAKHLIKRWEN